MITEQDAEKLEEIGKFMLERRIQEIILGDNRWRKKGSVVTVVEMDVPTRTEIWLEEK